MLLVSLPLAGLVIYHVQDTSYGNDNTVFVDDPKVGTDDAAPATAVQGKDLPPVSYGA